MAVMIAAKERGANRAQVLKYLNSGDVTGVCEAYKNSPLFTSKQHLVPVSPDELLTQNSGLAVVIPIKYAIELLRKNGVTDFSTR
jgi:hypothetical protein